MRMRWKGSNFEKRRRKNLPRCNQRDDLRPEDKVSKMFQRNRKQSIIFPAGSSLPIAVDFILSYDLKTRGPLSAFLRRFVPILRGRRHLYTSEIPKRGVGAVVRRCREAQFCLRNIKRSTEGTTERLGKLPSLPAAVCRSFGPDFSAFGFGKMPRIGQSRRFDFKAG